MERGKTCVPSEEKEKARVNHFTALARVVDDITNLQLAGLFLRPHAVVTAHSAQQGGVWKLRSASRA